MNRSTDRAFREISNSIVSACCCSSCGGTCAALGFQAPFPRSCREAACWLHIGNHRLGRKPEPCKTNSASHLDCARAATEVLAAYCCLSLSFLPLTAHGYPPAAAPLHRDTPWKRSVPDRSSLPFWDHLVAHGPAETWETEGGGSCIISRRTRRGGRNLALEELQLYIHPSWVCLSSSLPPARVSACGYSSLQLHHTLQPLAILPFPGSMGTPFIPHTLRPTARPPSDSASSEAERCQVLFPGLGRTSPPHSQALSSSHQR